MIDPMPVNTQHNPHAPWPIEPLCCSFHYPHDEATTLQASKDAAAMDGDAADEESEG